MIFAIDPGSEKTGTALVNEDGTLFKKKIIPTDTLEDVVDRIHEVGFLPLFASAIPGYSVEEHTWEHEWW